MRRLLVSTSAERAETNVCQKRTLQEEYKAALHAWTEVRSAYPLKIVSPEILEATKQLVAVELKLRNHRAEHGC